MEKRANYLPIMQCPTDHAVPYNDEFRKALDKLLEAKDCAVRAHIYKEP
jgi:hypothetical protein